MEERGRRGRNPLFLVLRVVGWMGALHVVDLLVVSGGCDDDDDDDDDDVGVWFSGRRGRKGIVVGRIYGKG